MARKKPARRDDDSDAFDYPDGASEEIAAGAAVAEYEALARRQKPRDDAWTGLLGLALIALIGAAVLFYLDHSALAAQQVQPPGFTLPGLAAAVPAGKSG
jgi:peptidoglycan/LPS O-acetylase OafA/YrhL